MVDTLIPAGERRATSVSVAFSPFGRVVSKSNGNLTMWPMSASVSARSFMVLLAMQSRGAFNVV